MKEKANREHLEGLLKMGKGTMGGIGMLSSLISVGKIPNLELGRGDRSAALTFRPNIPFKN